MMTLAIQGGRNASTPQRLVAAMLYGWGVTREADDQAAIDRMRAALSMIEESRAVTEAQLFEASCQMVGRYLRRHPEALATLYQYLPVVATEAGESP